MLGKHILHPKSLTIYIYAGLHIHQEFAQFARQVLNFKLNGYLNVPRTLFTAKPQDGIHVLQMLAI